MNLSERIIKGYTEPYSTYKVRQMDDLMIHEIFGR